MKEPELGEAGNPYAAPGTDAADEPRLPAPAAHAEGYRAQSALARVLVVLLGTQGATHAFNAVSCAIVLAGTTTSVTDGLVRISTGIQAVYQLLYWAGVIAFGMFVLRANKNARAFIAATPGPDLAADFLAWQPINGFSPASMVWWYFVPIFCWFKPYQATKAVWFCSAPDSSGVETAARGDVLVAWWAGWITLTLSNIAQSMLGKQDAHTHNSWNAVAGVLGALACMTALSMVRALQQRQVTRAAEIWP